MISDEELVKRYRCSFKISENRSQSPRLHKVCSQERKFHKLIRRIDSSSQDDEDKAVLKRIVVPQGQRFGSPMKERQFYVHAK